MHTVLKRTAPDVPAQWWVVYMHPQGSKYWLFGFSDMRDAIQMASFMNGGEYKLSNPGWAELNKQLDVA